MSFDATLLRGGKLVVQPNATAHPTMLQVLFNSSLFCIEPLPVQAQTPSCSLKRALLTLKVNPGSRYRCGKSS